MNIIHTIKKKNLNEINQFSLANEQNVDLMNTNFPVNEHLLSC